MASDKNNLERVDSDSPNQDLDSSFTSKKVLFETLRQKTQKLAGILPLTLIELFNPTHLQSLKETSSQVVNPPTHLKQPVIAASPENILSPTEFQETQIDTVFVYPPERTIEYIKQGEYTFLSKYSTISILGMGDIKNYFKEYNIDWKKENTKIDSLKLKITAEIPFEKLGITGEENTEYIKQQIIQYYNLNQEYPFHFGSSVGPIFDYDEQDGMFPMLKENSIDILWKIQNINNDTKIIFFDTQNHVVYVQFTAKAIRNTIYDQNSNGRQETDEEYYERLKQSFLYMYKLPNIPAKGGFVLNISLPRHFDGVWGDNPILKVPCADTDKLNLPFPSRFAALAQFEIGTQIEYINPDTTGAPGDSTGTPGDSTSTNPDNPNGNPEIPESYRLQVYPNPAEAGQMVNVLVHIPEPGNYTLRLFNLLGQEIWRKDYFINQKRTDHIFQFPTLRPDGQPHPRGIYFLQFSDTNGKTTPAIQKLIITPQP